ncbi:MAG: sugar phosphate isomerase/epimerase [Clostridia bacterium]|nr:sugar phosphate isomerase/epimerase [Clostridia bacterium]
MKTALNAWTVEKSLPMADTFAAVAAAGFAGIELNIDRDGASPHALSMATTQADYEGIRTLSAQYSLPVCSISTSLWGGKMGIAAHHGDAEALLFKQIEAASALGADGVLTVPGGMGDGVSLDAVRRTSIDFLRAHRDEIERRGIFVGVENVWNGFFLSPYDMATFIDAVGSPMIGAYLDAGNMLAFSTPEYWIEVLGARIGKVHVKDYLRSKGINSGGTWQDITHGSADWRAIIPALRAAGYDGYLVGEVFKADAEMSYTDYYTKVAGEIGEIITY